MSTNAPTDDQIATLVETVAKNAHDPAALRDILRTLLGSADIPEVYEVDPEQIRFDPNNYNLGNERGMHQLEESLQDMGAGRGVLLDADMVAMAGNKTLEKWLEQGGKVVVVPTDGKTLVATQRTDLRLSEDELARRLAAADNIIGVNNYTPNYEMLARDLQANRVDLSDYLKPTEVDDIMAHIAGTPDLDALEAKWGQPSDEALWPSISEKVPPEVRALYDRLMEKFTGPRYEGFRQILEAAADGLA